MLVLSRRESERLLLPTLGISIQLVAIQGRKARIGIEAPQEIPVVREEIADLKGVDLVPDEATNGRRLADVNCLIRERLESCSAALNMLHQHIEGDIAGQSLVMDVFNELSALQNQVTGIVGDDEVQQTKHVMIVAHDNNEREMLASCLRVAGFEVTTVSSADEGFGFLSLHASPDFAIIDSDFNEEFINAIGTEVHCQDMRLVGIGACDDRHDCSFQRPIDVAHVVDELSRKSSGRMQRSYH